MWRFGFLLVCVGAPSVRAQTPLAAADTIPLHPWVSDGDLALLGLASLPALAARAVPSREVRIWVAAWRLEGPRPMLRISQGPKTTIGNLIYWWDRPRRAGRASPGSALLDSLETESVRRSREQAAREYRCAAPAEGTQVETCQAEMDPQPDWPGLMARIDSLNPWELPDPRTLDPPLPAGLDGWSILIETQVGRRFRRVKYWVPTADQGPEARRALGLAAILRSVEP